MGFFDKTIKFIEETPVEKLQKELEEYGVKFVPNPNYCKNYGNPEHDVGACVDCEIEKPERFNDCFELYKQRGVNNETKR